MPAPLGSIIYVQPTGHVRPMVIISCTSFLSLFLVKTLSLTSFLSKLYNDIQVHVLHLSFPFYYYCGFFFRLLVLFLIFLLHLRDHAWKNDLLGMFLGLLDRCFYVMAQPLIDKKRAFFLFSFSFPLCWWECMANSTLVYCL